MNNQSNISEIYKSKTAQMACMVAESETKIVEDWCLNAKERRSSTLNNLLFMLRIKLSKKAEELDRQ